jgi:hypothetical protein
MYERNRRATGVLAPPLLGSVPVQRVVQAMMRAIEQDVPEITVTKYPTRPLMALSQLSPRFGEWLMERIGGHGYFRRMSEVMKRMP